MSSKVVLTRPRSWIETKPLSVYQKKYIYILYIIYIHKKETQIYSIEGDLVYFGLDFGPPKKEKKKKITAAEVTAAVL